MSRMGDRELLRALNPTGTLDDLRYHALQEVNRLAMTGLPGPSLRVACMQENDLDGRIAVSLRPIRSPALAKTIAPDWREGGPSLLDYYLAGVRRMAWELGCGHPVFRIGRRSPRHLKRKA